MINCTKHSVEQYAKRIKEIDKDSLRSNVTMNREQYEKDLNKMYDNSKIIFTGKFDNHKMANYRLADNIILITDKTDQNLITLYRVDFDFDRDTNKIVLDSLLIKLDKAKAIYLEKKEQADADKKKLDNERLQLLLDIDARKEELKKLEESYKILEDCINVYSKDEIEAEEKMNKIARKIVYSIEYRNTIKEIEAS